MVKIISRSKREIVRENIVKSQFKVTLLSSGLKNYYFYGNNCQWL